jgi:hypothetical protein
MNRCTDGHIKRALTRLVSVMPILDALSDVGKTEIIHALERHCQDDEHVSLVVQTFQDSITQWFNPIAELVKIAKATAKPERPPDGCDRCMDEPDPKTGAARWLPFVEHPRGNAMMRCVCARGVWMRGKDAENDREREKTYRPWGREDAD